MLNENPMNNDYLISVKKAIKQSQSMLDMGLNSLTHIKQIVAFLKVEELRSMVDDLEHNHEVPMYDKLERPS